MSPLIDRFHSESIGLGRSLVWFILNRLVYRARNQYTRINNHGGANFAYRFLHDQTLYHNVDIIFIIINVVKFQISDSQILFVRNSYHFLKTDIFLYAYQ